MAKIRVVFRTNYGDVKYSIQRRVKEQKDEFQTQIVKSYHLFKDGVNVFQDESFGETVRQMFLISGKIKPRHRQALRN